MRQLLFAMLAASLLVSCTSNDLPNIVELDGKNAADAVSRVDRHDSSYVDIMPNGSLVLVDKAVTRDQFRAGVAALVAQGDGCLTVRIAQNSPKEAFEFVRKVAEETGIQTLEVVHYPLKSR